MKHLRSIVLAVALIAAGATACFKDPTSSLRNGPSLIDLTRSSMYLKVGDSLSVQAVVKDAQGNTYDAGDADWTSDVPAVAVVRKDTVTVPFNAYSAAFVRGVAAPGGVATVTVTSHGLTKSLRVVILPVRLTTLATVAVSGTAQADTIKGPPLVAFSAGDTVTFTTVAGGVLSFRSDSSLVSLGPTRPYMISRTSSVIRVIARATFSGRPFVTKLTWAGPTAVGNITLDSLQSDSILVAKPRFNGTITQTGDTMFLNAPAGLTFNTAAPLSSVRFDTSTAILLGATSTQLKVISPLTYTGGITIRNVKIGATAVDSVRTTAAFTINQASFGGTVTTLGSQLDTVFVRTTAVTKLDTGSVVTIGGVAAWVLKKFPTPASTTTLDSMYVVAKLASAAPATISRVNVGGTIIPSLATAGNVVIGPATGEANEPGNNARATATALDLTGTTAANPLVVYGAMDETTDGFDYYIITLASAAKVKASIAWFGTGSGANTSNPDFDVIICGPAPVATCGYADDLVAGAASGVSMPETFTSATLAAGQYYIRTFAYVTPGPVTYKLTLNLQ